MKNSLLAFVLAAGSLVPGAYAQAQSNTAAQHSEEHSSTKVAPDGTAVQQKSSAKERVESTNNSDGSSSTTRSKETQTKTKVNSETATPAPADSTTSSEHHSSTTSSTTTTVK